MNSPFGQFATRLLCWPYRAGRQFLRDESGSILPFSLIIFLTMMMAGGLAIDVMRQERARVLLQNTLDRAVLAAADLDQTRDAETVVLDYFKAAKLSDAITATDVRVQKGLNFKIVEASADLTIPTYFLNMVGIKTLTSPASGTAEERVSNVEISLVVDISGSMGGSRISNLKTAANEFIDTVIDATEPTLGGDDGVTSLSIVPYQGLVNIGDTLGAQFNLSSEHNASQCAVFDRGDYDTTTLPPTQSITRMSHFDRSTSGGNSPIARPNCPTSDSRAVIAHSVSRSDLKSKISSLGAGGWTAIDVGLKWGVALLDPSTRPVTNALESAGVLNETLRDRPANYNDPNNLKVLVLMTDGENTYQHDLKSQFKTGMSDVWKYTNSYGDIVYSAYMPSLGLYYVPYYNNYYSQPYGNSQAVQMSNPELFATFSVRYIANYFFRYRDTHQYNRYRNAVESISWNSRANERTRALCTVAKNAGIVIFAIGFEAPSGGQSLMKFCASSDSHYFDVNGVEISEAFGAIAQTINQLKLVQ